MMEIVISAQALERLAQDLTRETEWGAALYLKVDAAGERYLVHEWDVATSTDVIAATQRDITFAPQFLTRCTRLARSNGSSLALIHTHPQGAGFFSSVDDQAEQKLEPFMRERCHGHLTFSMVMCDGALLARVFGSRHAIPVRVVGKMIEVSENNCGEIELNHRFDRQIQAFGKGGQAILNRLTIAIVGLGGTGSVLAQQLAHLGIRSFILIDPDNVEGTNLNRVVGTGPDSIGHQKIDIAGEMILRINPNARIDSLNTSVISDEARILLCKSHCIFMCTDSHSSRAFLSEFSYQYLIPAFDMGVSINAGNGVVKAITGRVQMVGPELPCLLCSNALDTRRIREELMTPEQRAADPYFNEGAVTQPAVISINSTIVSLAVTMFLSAFTGIPAGRRWLSYDGITSTLRTLSASIDPDCTVCGASNGINGLGDARHLSFLP